MDPGEHAHLVRLGTAEAVQLPYTESVTEGTESELPWIDGHKSGDQVAPTGIATWTPSEPSSGDGERR